MMELNFSNCVNILIELFNKISYNKEFTVEEKLYLFDKIYEKIN